MDATLTVHPIYRYKLAAPFQERLRIFAQEHKHLEDPSAFRNAWEQWVGENAELLERETRRLSDMGYEGSVSQKIYKSARHYHRLRSQDRPEPRQRRKYVALPREVLDLMDGHITEVAFPETLRPAEAYLDFQRTESGKGGRSPLPGACAWLCETHNYTAQSAEQKVKKTYKNRYFKEQKRLASSE